jgi:HEAT repeats
MSGEATAIGISVLVMDFISALRGENLTWQKETQDKSKALQVRQTLSSEKLRQEIQKLKFEFEQEIIRKEHYFQLELEKEKLKAEANIKNYQRFLEAIDDLKDKLKELYPNMPPALVLVIHDYTLQLLHKMWDSPDSMERLALRRELVQVLTLVSEDANQAELQGGTDQSAGLPKKILKYIQDRDDTPAQYQSLIAEAETKISPEIEISTLLKALSAVEARVRSEAALELGKIGDEAAVPYLVQALSTDDNPEVRRSAAEALGMIGSEEQR